MRAKRRIQRLALAKMANGEDPYNNLSPHDEWLLRRYVWKDRDFLKRHTQPLREIAQHEKRDPQFPWRLMSNVDVEMLRLAVKVQDALIADKRI